MKESKHKKEEYLERLEKEMSNNVSLLITWKIKMNHSSRKKWRKWIMTPISNTLDINNDKSDTDSDPEEQVDTQMELVWYNSSFVNRSN